VSVDRPSGAASGDDTQDSHDCRFRVDAMFHPMRGAASRVAP
jgi:hypothetical protein